MDNNTDIQPSENGNSNIDHDGDYFLQSLVSLANKGAEFDITLTVGGFLVSGTLVSGKRFFDEYLVGGINTPDTSLRATIEEYYHTFGALYNEPDETEAPPPLPYFLHLRNARFFHNSGNPMPANTPVWWRGLISAVAGFTMGSMFVSRE